MPSHMTLCGPGKAKVDRETAVATFRKLRLRQSMFLMKSTRLGIFLNGDHANVVYLGVLADSSLVRLHNTLSNLASGFMETSRTFAEYIPHVTLAGDVADETDALRIKEDLVPDVPSIMRMVSRIVLFAKSDEEPEWVKLAVRDIASKYR